jgi:hypothetical protein
MKNILIGLAIGVVLTVLSFILAALADGACHCVKPTIIFFPYAALALTRSWESISLPLMALQFPIYAISIAKVRGIRWKLLTFIILVLLHVGSAAIGLKIENP